MDTGYTSTTHIRIEPDVLPQSKLRLIAGSDAVVVNHPSPKPNWFVRLLVRHLLGMEWIDG